MNVLKNFGLLSLAGMEAVIVEFGHTEFRQKEYLDGTLCVYYYCVLFELEGNGNEVLPEGTTILLKADG